ncbi:MAG: hypothetical protein PHD05_00575 [Sphaerochaetaceae bacterium]|jgi:hypothetical protein|nr:hypothetical protein [Sphaerochaetaceae bacterium]
MKRRRYYKGRRISKGEKRISEFFDLYNISYVREKSFTGCTSLKGNLLRFDFYLEQFNLLIEYQGQHHIKPINKYRRAQIVHKTTVLHDKLKEIFATGRNIKLLKIYYMDYDNIEIILKSTLRQFLDVFRKLEASEK